MKGEIMAQDPDRLNSMKKIIDYIGLPARTLYDRGYIKNLKESGYLFRTKTRLGKPVYWSYKPLILAWMAEMFGAKNIGGGLD